MQQLAHDVIGTGSRRAVFLHGILGSRNNWKSFARKFVEARPEFRAVLVDLRNHGDSHGFPRPHTVEACAADVLSLLGDGSAPVGGDVVIGHSYGGKVALVMKRERPEITAWILDAPPSPRAFSGASDVERVIAAVQSVPMPVESRKALVEILRERGLSEPLALWMTTNLKEGNGDGGGNGSGGDGTGGNGKLVWRFDIDAIHEMLASFGALDLWPVVEGNRDADSLHLVKAARSERWGADVAHAERCAAEGKMRFHVVENAGHWLHTDNPAAVLALIAGETR